MALFGQKMTHALRSEMSKKLIRLPAGMLAALRRAAEGRTVLSISHRVYGNEGARRVVIGGAEEK